MSELNKHIKSNDGKERVSCSQFDYVNCALLNDRAEDLSAIEFLKNQFENFFTQFLFLSQLFKTERQSYRSKSYRKIIIIHFLKCGSNDNHDN